MIYLYLKIHNQTGLKYFGKTIRDDFDVYQGSGRYWSNHIRKHGYDVTTYLMASFHDDDLEGAQEYGLWFSEEFDIANCSDFANLREEAIDGGRMSEESKRRISKGQLGKVLSDETKLKISRSQKGKVVSDETRAKLSAIRHSEETKLKISRSLKGRKTGGKPPSFKGKKHSEETKLKMAKAKRGRKQTPEHIAAMIEGKRKAREERNGAPGGTRTRRHPV